MITKKNYKNYKKFLSKGYLQYRTIKEWETFKAKLDTLKENIKLGRIPELEEGEPCFCLGDGLYAKEELYEGIFEHKVQQEIFFILINENFTQETLDHILDLLDKDFYDDFEEYGDQLINESEVYCTTYEGGKQ